MKKKYIKQKFSTKLGTLYHGNCLDIIPELEMVDFVLGDIPYGTTSCRWDSILPFDLMWKVLKNITKKNGAIALFGSEPFSTALRMSNIKNYKYDWIWEKSMPTGMATSSFMPMKYHEIISVFVYNKKPTFNKIMAERSEAGKTRAKTPITGNSNLSSHNTLGKHKAKQYNPTKVNPKSILKFNSVPNSPTGSKIHPTQKPVKLMEYLIKTYTNENETVLDFVIGSGSTAIACENLNRRWIGIEIEEEYYEAAKYRIINETWYK